ncbi:hypothetical protein SHPE106448_11105 [Shewanella pealeana]
MPFYLNSYSCSTLLLFLELSRYLDGYYTNQYKKLIYSERFWQTNSRRIAERMVFPCEAVQHRIRKPKRSRMASFSSSDAVTLKEQEGA